MVPKRPLAAAPDTDGNLRSAALPAKGPHLYREVVLRTAAQVDSPGDEEVGAKRRGKGSGEYHGQP